MLSTPVPVSSSSTNTTSSAQLSVREMSADQSSSRNFIQKQFFPKFSGEMRDYIGFRKEWQETVAPSHDKVLQLWEICKAIPVKIQPDIKNLMTMAEVWKALDKEFRQIMKSVSSLVKDLVALKYPRGSWSSLESGLRCMLILKR